MMRTVASEVVYSGRHWEMLGEQRARAISIMRPLHDSHIHCAVYGSIARGDTSDGSDIDVFIPTPPSPTMIEAVLESSGIRYRERQIIQATPSYAAKGYIIIDDLNGYSFPLVDMRSNEAEFTKFAGQASFIDLQNYTRNHSGFTCYSGCYFRTWMAVLDWIDHRRSIIILGTYACPTR